jgi:hypothetical protein
MNYMNGYNVSGMTPIAVHHPVLLHPQSGLHPYLPLSAGPHFSLAPQGVFGSLVGAVAPTIGQVVGGIVGHPNAGQQIGSVAGHLAGLLPFSAEPQMALAPQGVLGNLIGAVGPTIGHVVGGFVGHPNAGQQIGSFAGQFGHLLPFSAQPAIAYAR